MGDTIWVDVEGRTQDEELSDNSIMLRLKDDLDALSQALGVAKLSDFYDYSELAAQYGAAGDSQAGCWFEAGPALEAVRAIAGYLSQRPDAMDFSHKSGRSHWPQTVIRELNHCDTMLERAVSQRRKFRFLIVP